jgi:hypothetical protein
LNILGYKTINDFYFIKTYHYHKETKRDYGIKDVISEPWGVIIPAGVNIFELPVCLGIDLQKISQYTRCFQDVCFEDNATLFDYIQKKVSTNTPFIIPRVCGIENNIALLGSQIKNINQIPQNIQEYIQQIIPAMKNNAGIRLTTMNSVISYSNMYLKAFDNCEMFAGWEVQGKYINHIQQSYNMILNRYSYNRKIVWAFNFDIFHYIHSQPFTQALRGKRILIVSPFEESIKEKIPIREKIYGIDLFPDCVITTIKPPQTQAGENSREFDIELALFCNRLDAIKDTYDVALVSCGGYGNLVCNHIYESGRSAIYVGGVLQMYFGILGNRWLKERPDVVRLYLNEYWSRPKITERPKNCENVEGGCYW